ncbi:MAG: peptide chain release factor N(5)-glutamine methyltransferase [Chloroflexi bacterium]|nr:peptide chain release factor N(5)-glutamine methyltransferase [Chloroflexota bacterium]MBP8058375.1 peptide chain release factor N(5)-glutamine methyltransferase [Chloroflexota bacterium]
MRIDAVLGEGQRRLWHRYGAGAEARYLLAQVLGVGQSYLLAHGDETCAAAALVTYHTYLDRAEQGEPIPYILGQAPFFDLHLKVSPAVLIPRPETEQLVEIVLRWLRQQRWPTPQLVDVGTGSGCIAITLARQLPQAYIDAVDVSAAALELAKENAHNAGVHHQISFYQGHLLTPITTPPHLIVANLPYIGDDEWTLVDDGVKSYEPALALRGGADGLDLIRPLLAQAQEKLQPGGAIFLEIGWQQGAAALLLAQHYFPHALIRCDPDYAGKDRFIVILTKGIY